MADPHQSPRRPKRRNAIKHGNVVEIKGHKFVLTYFKSFTFCGHCTRFLWGVTGPQGYKCLTCDFAIHKRCLEFVSFSCPGTSLPAGMEPRPHDFKTTTFFHPTFCEHCGSMIYGLFNQGVKCNDCGMCAHKKCQGIIPHTCGMQIQEKHGRINLSYYTERLKEDEWKINIEVHESRNLPPMDPNGLADPYVKLCLICEHGQDIVCLKQKSEIKTKTLEPIFNESFFFYVCEKNLDHYIHVSVWDWNRISSNECIGGMSLKVNDVITDTCEGQKVKSWFKLLDGSSGKKRSQRIVSDEEAEEYIEQYRTTVHNNKLATLDAELGVEFKRGSNLDLASSGLPKMTLDDFNLIVVLGKGSFGKVFLAEHISSKEMYAIKSLKKDLIVKDDVQYTLNERKVLALRHKPPFLTSLHSCFQTREHLFFVMEFINGGDLMFHILEMGRFSENQTCFYAAEICLGLFYLHERGIIYRDLKLDNVMLDSEGHIKIADFGLCKEGILHGVKTKTFCGTPEYIAPEIIAVQPYGKAVDWWALGILTYEMLIGQTPFDGDTDDQLFNNITSKSVHYPKGMSESAKKFIQGFLTKLPITRLGCHPVTGNDDIKGHTFFRAIDWEKLANRKIKPPFKPNIKGKRSYNNFDSEFTSERCALSLVEESVIANFDKELFTGFSFTNPDLYIAP